MKTKLQTPTIGQIERIRELEDALRACWHIATHPRATKAEIIHIIKDGEMILARTVQSSKEQEVM
jgi:hypothetical protein